MKRLSVFLIAIISTLSLAGCGIKNDSQEEIPETTEEVIDDTISDYSTLSYKELEVLAYGDDPQAQYYLGLMYEYGTEDTNQDFDAALEWYQKSAAFDNADAVCALGYFYLNGCGVDQDLDLAKEQFDQAILLGSMNAKVGLGRTILASLSDEDLATIISIYNPAEDDTDDYSDDAYTADVTDTSDDDSTDEAIDDSDDLSDLKSTATDIYTCFRDAQAAGDLDGIYYYGYIHEYGIGIKQDATKAKDYYEQVLKTESTVLTDQNAINMANTSLGLLYMNGTGVIQNDETALNYFMAASDNGFAKAQFYVGQIYENGLGVDVDYEKAMEYYKLAADSDYAPALNQIGYLYFNGYGVDVDFSSAVYYQKLAALQGYAPAQVNLGFLYENGYGVERNLDTALSYYELAAASGYEGAEEATQRVRGQINEEM